MQPERLTLRAVARRAYRSARALGIERRWALNAAAQVAAHVAIDRGLARLQRRLEREIARVREARAAALPAPEEDEADDGCRP